VLNQADLQPLAAADTNGGSSGSSTTTKSHQAYSHNKQQHHNQRNYNHNNQQQQRSWQRKPNAGWQKKTKQRWPADEHALATAIRNAGSLEELLALWKQTSGGGSGGAEQAGARQSTAAATEGAAPAAAPPAAGPHPKQLTWAPCHAAAALMQLARASPKAPKQRADKAARGELAAGLLAAVVAPAGGTPAATPRDASSALWALAKMELPPTHAELMQLLGLMVAVPSAQPAAAVASITEGSSLVGSSGPSSEQPQPPPQAAAAVQATAQDASMALWAVATAAASPSPPRGLFLSDLDPLLDLIQSRLPTAAPQALSNVAWALATVRLAVLTDGTADGVWPPREWLARFEERVALDLWAHSPLGLYNLLWGLAKLRWSLRPALLETAVAAAAATADEASPQAASGALWALAALGAKPGAGFFFRWHAATRAAVGSTWGPVDIVNALWAHAVLGEQPPADWLASALARVRAGAPGYSQTELCTVLWACARMGAAPRADWMAAWMDAYGRRAFDVPLSPTLAGAAYAMALLRFRPPLEWAGRLVAEAAHQMECMGPQQLANLLWALARLRLTPTTAWMNRFLRQVGCPGGFLGVVFLRGAWVSSINLLTKPLKPQTNSIRLVTRQASLSADAFDSQELSNMIWALAALQPRRPPPRGWLVAMLSHWEPVGGRPPGVAAREVSMLLWAFARWNMTSRTDG
jgi:hypothetical protein